MAYSGDVVAGAVACVAARAEVGALRSPVVGRTGVLAVAYGEHSEESKARTVNFAQQIAYYVILIETPCSGPPSASSKDRMWHAMSG